MGEASGGAVPAQGEGEMRASNRPTETCVTRKHKSASASDDVVEGKIKTLKNVHVLRTAPCSGDAWAGLFFDLQVLFCMWAHCPHVTRPGFQGFV
jgi:hypothetical protein